MNRTSKVRRSRQLFIQKLVGVGLLLLSLLIVLAALSGTNDADRDVTPILLLAPLGVFLVFTKRIYLIF